MGLGRTIQREMQQKAGQVTGPEGRREMATRAKSRKRPDIQIYGCAKVRLTN